MSDGSDIQPQKVGGVEKIVLRHNLKEVWLLIPDGVEVLVVPDPLLRVLPLLLGPLVLRQHVVHHCLQSHCYSTQRSDILLGFMPGVGLWGR